MSEKPDEPSSPPATHLCGCSKKNSDEMTLSKRYNQIVVITTFTAAVIVAFMSYMTYLRIDVDHDQLHHSWSYYGVRFGLISLCCNLGIAALANINTALAESEFAISKEKNSESALLKAMKFQEIICVVAQFVSATLSGISLIFFIMDFDWRVAIIATIAYYLGIAIAIINLIQRRFQSVLGLFRLTYLPIVISILISASTLAVAMRVYLGFGWTILPTSILTILHHCITGLIDSCSLTLHLISLIPLAILWFFSASVMLRLVPEATRLAPVILACLEGLIVIGLGVWFVLIHDQSTRTVNIHEPEKYREFLADRWKRWSGRVRRLKTKRPSDHPEMQNTLL